MKWLLPTLLAGASLATAQDTTDSQSGGGPDIAATAGWYWNPEADFSEGEGGFESSEYRIIMPLYGGTIGDRMRYGAKLRYGYHQLSIPATGELPGDLDLHRLSISTDFYSKLGDGSWFFWGQLAPTYGGDGDASFSDAMSLSAVASVGYEFSDDLWLAVGAYAGESFGEYQVYPSIALRWTPTEDWRLDLVPPNLTATWAPADKWRFHVGAFPGGGTWALDQPNSPEIDTLGYRDIRMAIGVDYEIAPKWWLSAWAGGNLFQELEFRDGGDDLLFDREIEDSLFFYLGLRYHFR